MVDKLKSKIEDFIDKIILDLFIITSNIRRWDRWEREVKKIKDLNAKIFVTMSVLENQRSVNRYLFIGKDINNG